MANFRAVGQRVLCPATDCIDISNAPEEAVVKMPRLGFGTYMISARDAEAAVLTALREGYRHIDTAQLYRNEAAVGRAVRASGLRREQVFVTTKLWNADNGYDATLSAFHRSLSELGLDYVDLYLLHSPMRVDARLDSWRAMEDLLRGGRVRAIGVSNFGQQHLEELFAACSVRPAVNQVELHPFGTRRQLVDFCQQHGIAMQAYSPLTKGTRLRDPTLVEMAARYQKSTAQLMVRWCLQKGFVVLPRSVNPAHIAANTQVYDFSISDIDMAKLDSLNEDYVTGWDPTRGP
ncbi:hypothetical protein CLOM_g21270 [Closterium sp. NIES-68]|nr:hypothetical protein CLOM_g21270 [Closterium sp. NIES-68]GJP78560.1 hypothetical protein CLOP_g8850 [Closterium sp. NIES-67]